MVSTRNPRPDPSFAHEREIADLLSGFRGLEVAREGDRARVPDGSQRGFAQIGPGFDAAALRGLDQGVEQGGGGGQRSGGGTLGGLRLKMPRLARFSD